MDKKKTCPLTECLLYSINHEICQLWWLPQQLKLRWEVFISSLFQFLRQKLNEDFCKGSLLSKEFFVGPDFSNPSILDHDNVVHFRQVRDTVSDQNSGLSSEQTFSSDHLVEDVFPDVGINSWQGVIEEVYVSFSVDGSSKGYPVFLATCKISKEAQS